MDNQNETSAETGPSVREALETATGAASEATPESSSVRDTLKAALEAHTSDDTPNSERPTPKQRAEQLTGRDAPIPATVSTTAGSTARTPAGLDPPPHYSDADKALFAKAPREVQDAWLRRERETNEGLQRMVQPIAPLLQTTQRLKPYLDHIGAAPHDVLQHTAQWDYLLRHGTPAQKTAAVQKLAKDYQVDLAGLTGGDEWEDPAVAALRQQMQAQAAQVQEQALQVRQHLIGIQRDHHLREITALESEKNAKGEPTNPHLGIVANDIARIAYAERAAGRPIPPLKQMYDLAVQHNPQAKALIAKQQAEQRRQTEAAVRARKPAPKAPAGSVRATLEQAMRA